MSARPERKLNASTDGIATTRPIAVTISASEMPAETAPRPPEPSAAMPWNAPMMPMTVPPAPDAPPDAPLPDPVSYTHLTLPTSDLV